ncbi:MAG: mechanosensitive ion channel family protein [Polyangiaceae bacterium]
MVRIGCSRRAHRLSLAALVWLAAVISAAGLFAPAASAQTKPAPTASADAGPPPEPEAAPDSPRASVRRYVDACRAGDYEEAARFLDVPNGKGADGPTLARKLKSVLDRRLWDDVDLATLASPFSSGNTADKLPPGIDELGTIPGPGAPEPVRITRRPGAGGATWVFTRSTVERIDVWYARLDERWLFDSLPEPILRPGPFDILWWQYIAMPAIVLVAWLLGRLFGYFTRKVIARMVARTASRWDDALLTRIGPPLTLAWGLGAFALLVPRLGLYEPARDSVQKLVRAGFLVALFWSALRALDVARSYVMEAAVPGRASARSLVPLGTQITKLLVMGAAAVMVLSELGYPVGSLIAGLGIGGIALALAAQKTVENLFGSLSIGVDQPFRVGDFVKVEDVSGTVETVGLRSTRIRTLDRTLVTIPNGKLADMRIECFSVRDRFKFAATLGVVYGTTAEQLRAIVRDVEAALHEEPKLYQEGCSVVVRGLGASSIDIDVLCWFEVDTVDAFAQIRQAMLLRFVEIVEKNGSSLAFPTQTVHHVSAPAGAPLPSRTE